MQANRESMSLFGHLLNTSPAPPGVRGDSIASYPFDGPDTEPLLWFRVTFGPRIALRAGPSKSARTVGCLKVDEVVAVSELQDGWGRLASQELPLRATPGNHEAWALIDGTSIGLGPLLQPLEGRFTAAKAVAGAKTRLHDGLCLYLNLTRRSDRRSNMESLFAPHDWLRAAMTRIPSVDGQDLSWPQLVREGLFSQEAWDVARTAESEGQPTIGHEPGSFSAHLTLGGCGCALSHGRAWRALVNSDRSWALILEDDLTAIPTERGYSSSTSGPVGLRRGLTGASSCMHVHVDACCPIFVLTFACFNAGGYKCKACEAPPWRPVP
mmetsp:Transcript_87574/g.272411  ORF Transcript_87574/g.272411 Transcript_87574/m.272411 type:complete len:325 (+) Transcript_87574:109-1083(+)